MMKCSFHGTPCSVYIEKGYPRPPGSGACSRSGGNMLRHLFVSYILSFEHSESPLLWRPLNGITCPFNGSRMFDRSLPAENLTVGLDLR